MPEPYRCPTCGNVLSETLGGQCPACLLQGGLVKSSAAVPGPDTQAYQSQAQAVIARTVPLPSPGQEFGGYHIVRELGQGGMGSVFEAEERDTGRRLALKVLNHSLDSPSARQRFLREGRLAASVNHRHSVYVFGTEEIQGAPVIAMELVQGGTLQQRVRKGGPMPIQEAVDAILQIADGLEAAQAVGVLHRDVKPSNCFVDADGRIKIGDFGLSISTVGRGDLQLTSSGVFLGTPTFASPEQLRGDELDQRSDQYAVGVTLYYLLTGKVPFEADTMVHLVARVLDKPAPDVRSLRPEVPRGLAAAIQCCLAKEPNRRYRSYADLRAALLPFSSLLPIAASPGRRFAAYWIDMGIILGLEALVAGLSSVFGFNLIALMMSWSGPLQPVMWLVGVGLIVLYFVLPEGLAGATLGKKVLGLRVVRQGQRQPPGVLRAGIRTLIFVYFPVWPFVLLMVAFPDMFGAEGLADPPGNRLVWLMAAEFGYLVCMGLLFVTMRRSNGYAGVHDLAGGARVIVRPTATHRPILPQARETEAEPQSAALTIGPYHVLANLGKSTGADWQLGFDPRLLRKVWLCVVPAGTPPVSPARQKVARPGRLRWLAGRRGPSENWDAFEAPPGQPLWQLLDHPHDWTYLRYWLLDLAEELAPALKRDTLPPTLGIGQVWISADGHAVLLDQDGPGLQVPAAASMTTQPGDVEPVKGFLNQVAVAALYGRRVGFAEAQADSFALPLPLYVRPIVEGLKKVERPEVTAAQIQTTLAKPTRVTKTRRAGLVACCVGIPLLALLGPMVMIGIERSAAPELIDLQNALQWYSPVVSFLPPPTDAEKKAIEIYLAGIQSKRINDPDTWTNPYMAMHVQPYQRAVAKEIVARTPAPKQEELQKALAVVGPHLRMLRDLGVFNQINLQVFLPLIYMIIALEFLAVPSILCALLFRGGLLWWMFGVSAVTKTGQRAGRLRLFARNMLAWAPLFIVAIALVVLAGATAVIPTAAEPPIMQAMPVVVDEEVFPMPEVAPGAAPLPPAPVAPPAPAPAPASPAVAASPFLSEPAAPVVLLALAYTALVLASTLSSKRSWPDRLAGTWLVIR